MKGLDVVDVSARTHAADLKLQMLSTGISVTESCIERFAMDVGLMERRRAYNDSRDRSLNRSLRIPQELRIEDIVVSVNHRRDARFKLEFDGTYLIRDKDSGACLRCEIPRRPTWLNHVLPNGRPVGHYANLYGGYSLAFFTPASCYYFEENIQCKYCSLQPNRLVETEFAGLVFPNDAAACLRSVLDSEGGEPVRQIMLVGGNSPDYDTGFLRYLAVIESLELVLREYGYDKSIRVHLAAMPPTNLCLLERLSALNCRVTFNLEVFDDDLFSKHCPGKAQDYGREHLKKALNVAVEHASGRIHSILIVGLEPSTSTCSGIDWLCEKGINPIANVFHNDVGAIYSHRPRPTYSDLRNVALHLQERYRDYAIVPYWDGCGRNALDYEAREQLFR